jgi:hypothetical protein
VPDALQQFWLRLGLTSRTSASNLAPIGGGWHATYHRGFSVQQASAQLRRTASRASFALYAPDLAAEIFKCVAKDGSGNPLFQNFPCSIDSLGLPSNPSGAKPASAAGTEKPNTQPTAAPATKTKAIEPQIGMSGEEVRAILGEPETIEEDEPGSGGRISTWRDAGGRALQLDRKQRVFAIQE